MPTPFGPSFELFVQSLADTLVAQGRNAAALAVPVGPSALRVLPDGPRFTTGGIDTTDHSGPPADNPLPAWRFERVDGPDRRPALLLTPPADGGTLVNGVACPPVAVLSAGDQLQLGDYLLHVALFNRPHVGPAPPELAGKCCPLCRGEFEPGSRVYRCHNCSAALHYGRVEAEPADTSDTSKAGDTNEVLECVKIVSECPACSAEIRLEEGYLHRPDLEG